VQDDDEEQAVTPEDPLNSYSQPSWRGLIITAVAVVVVTAPPDRGTVRVHAALNAIGAPTPV